MCGATGVRGAYIAPYDHQNARRQFGPFYEDELETRLSVKADNEGAQRAVLAFFEKIWDAAGESRPKELYGFPDPNTI